MASKVKLQSGSGSQGVKPICATCGKKHFGKCLDSTGGCFGCGRDVHKVRDCLTIVVRVREAKQVPPNAPNVCEPKRNHFYVLQAKANSDENASKL
ncbi:hypothetical protein EJD97_010091 [Solanum chilense]|uniref:CCHC-type domain-containing protein n=1 Tax=Solanum chilense TaxID=4083 RepID=A0A6N2CEU7_SOLCI|nr:hypothetical protein EJD97_010091 [Solanum chilense]